jgi:Fungal Zn(2)-Cys(6) binuclear cluster domain/Zinc finger, C2H2 type
MDLLCHAIGFSETQESGGPEPELHPRQVSVSDAHRKSTPSRSTANRRCHICGRCYERADHLNRHLKSHENARPHKCTRCNKSFNRADLLNRHQAAHDRPPAERPTIERGNRAATACIACVNAKAKCQDEKPCTRCQLRGISCQTFGNGAQSGRGRSISNLESESQNEEDLRKPQESEAPQPLPNFETRHTTNNTSRLHPGNSMPVETVLDPTLTDQDESAKHFQYNLNNSNNAYYNGVHTSSNLNTSFSAYEDITSLHTDGQYGQDFGLIPRSSYFSQDLDFGMWDFDLDTIELAGLNDSNTSLSGTDLNQSPKPSSRAPKDASKRYAAFERSPWLWTPTEHDQTMIDQQDLNLDEENIPAVLTPASPAARMDEFASCCIHHKERDKMLSLIFAISAAPTKSPYLPSLTLLNSIVQVYFVQESFKVDQLIHVGTFDPSKALPQLLTAIVASGSSLISTPAIWKMGLALQEVVRHSVANYVSFHRWVEE